MLRGLRPRPRLALGLQLRYMAKKGRGQANNNNNVVTMHGVKKVLPGGRVLLEHVNLKLAAGAKVGVLGANGAGKSSFLRIIAGWDADVEGDHWIRDGLKVGMLEQEPSLDEERDVLSNIMDGVGEQRDVLARFEAVNLELAHASPEQMDELVERQSEVMAELEVPTRRPPPLALGLQPLARGAAIWIHEAAAQRRMATGARLLGPRLADQGGDARTQLPAG